MRQLPPEPSHQEAYEGLIMNFILDQEEKVRQLEEYMCVIGSDFMQLSLKVVEKLKEEIRIKEKNSKRIQKITSYVHSKDSGPSQGLYLCQIVLRYRYARTELITPNMTYPLTPQLLRNFDGDSRPDLSFDKSASLERLFSLARVSLAEASKQDLSFGWSEGDYTSSVGFFTIAVSLNLFSSRKFSTSLCSSGTILFSDSRLY
nr:hypothetical protein [Tanacetum cinerariifolium]